MTTTGEPVALAFEFGPELDKLSAALVTFQGKVGAVAKTKTAKVQMKSGGSYTYDYADLADVIASTKDARTAAQLAVVQMPVNSDRGITIITTILHSSGQWMRSSLTMQAGDSSPQAIGSLITYGRRYSYSAALGICTEADDDGNAAQGHNAQTGGRGADPKAPSPGPTPGAPATSAAGKMEPTTKTAPSTPKPKGTGAADIIHDGVYITEGQLKVLHITRREAGGQWCTDGGKDEDDSRSLWRTKVLQVYRDKDGSRIVSSKQLSKTQANHLIDRLTAYAAKTKATMEQRDAETQVTDIMPAKRKPNGMTAATMSITGALKTKDMDASELCAVFGVDDVTEIANEDADKALALVFAWNTPKYAQVLAEVAGVPQ